MAKETYSVCIGVLYPDVLSEPGDKANISALSKRLTDREITASIINIPFDTPSLSTILNQIDALYIGGGDEKALLSVLEKLIPEKNILQEYIDQYFPVFSFSGSFPIFGHLVPLDGANRNGLGIIGMETLEYQKKAIGNVKAEVSFAGNPMVIYGFENHGYRVNIFQKHPFARILVGNGNNTNKEEGVTYKDFYGTWLTGPLLPQNPDLTDRLLDICLRNKYKNHVPLSPLDDTIEKNAIAEIEKKIEKKKGNQK